MGKNYAVMLAANKEIYLEEIWKDIDCRLQGSNDKLFFYCGKPLASNYYFERFENIIFRLMELKSMDGLITLTGTLSQYCGRDYFSNYVQRFEGIPMVSLSLELEGAHNVIMDNYGASRMVAEHAVVEHGFTRIAYIAGPVNNDEAGDRLKGLVDVLGEHGIALEAERFYQGDFSKHHGYVGASKLLEGVVKRPEVIICANDEMAIGVMDYALEHQIMIPEDLSVIGFDDIGLAQIHDPSLTTIKQPFSEKMSMAYDLIVSNEPVGTYSIDGQLISRVSCGCSNRLSSAEYEYHEKRLFMKRYNESLEGFSLMTHLSTSFSSITKLDELQARLKSFFNVHAMSEFYVALYSDFKQPVGKPEEFIYPEAMEFFFGYNRGDIFDKTTFSTEELLPSHIMNESKSNTYLVYALVFKDTSYGYLVCDSITAKSMAFVALKDMLVNSLNRIDMYQQVEAYSKKMETLSLKDHLTELFNRRGFSMLTENKYTHLIGEGKKPVVIYCDLVGLKRINDRYGHEAGDLIIRRAAEVLRGFFEEEGVIARIGGDEFLVFLDELEDQQMDSIEERLTRYVEKSNEGFHQPYGLEISSGICRYEPNSHMSLQQLIREADDRLYEGRKNSR